MKIDWTTVIAVVIGVLIANILSQLITKRLFPATFGYDVDTEDDDYEAGD